ncbi:MAG: hypothetical protein FJ278_22815, partial [Planctomycetes bacterium]|nr:hypothetical protein [Planctomycetota bacterium]
MLMLAVSLAAVPQGLAEDKRFVDHGVAVPLAESRGVITARDRNGRNLVIACSLDVSPRGWILVTDIDSE